MTTRERLGIAGIILGGAAGIMSGVNSVGETASLPNVLSLFFGGMAAGAGLVAALRKRSRSGGRPTMPSAKGE
jgi:crotonobetainyl-CoA:carnitine CoA-transferase CaiB-like acyl-CoA transferase